MATVHLGRLVSDFGVGRLVAVKRLHRHCAAEPDFVSMFLDEARLAARIRHPHVVSLLDLVSHNDELYMILEYVEGETLAKLVSSSAQAGEPIPDRIVAAVMAGALHGLHAAHEARTEDGTPLGIVHRDFTPQNVLVGTDGVARVADFGIAKAAVRLQHTREGQLKGKLAYMAPEQLGANAAPDRRTDIFSAGVVLWEMLARQRLFEGENDGQIVMKILTGAVDPPSDHVRGLDPAWDAIVERALALSPDRRYPTARAMAEAIEATFSPAPPSEVGAWVSTSAAAALGVRAGWVAEIERAPIATETEATTASPLTTETPAAPPGRRRTAATVGLAVAAIVAIGAVALARGGARGADESAAAVAPTEPAPPAEPAPAEPVPAASASTESEPEPMAPARSAPRRVPRGGARAPSTAAQPSATAKPSCRYYDAEEKIWKFRVECYK